MCPSALWVFGLEQGVSSVSDNKSKNRHNLQFTGHFKWDELGRFSNSAFSEDEMWDILFRF